MGFEYQAIATADLPSVDTHAALDGLVNLGRWIPLAHGEHRLVLRDVTQPQRDTWPEDIEVKIQGRQVYVLFHSGTANDRVDFLRELSAQFHSVGIALRFEDL